MQPCNLTKKKKNKNKINWILTDRCNTRAYTLQYYWLCMSSSKDAAHCKDSTANLLRLFNGGRADHRVVTRRDLTTDYPGNDDNDNSPRPSNSDDVVAINNYYTWNSSRTNSSIHKYAWRARMKVLIVLYNIS